jgi:uncharacterized protein (DUF4415 family)
MRNNKIKKPELTPELRKKLKKAPAFDLKDIPELKDFKPGKPVARGFAQFKEYINRNGRPKSEDPRVNVSIRLPQSYAARLRSTGPGWQTRMGEYVINGINRNDKELLVVKSK